MSPTKMQSQLRYHLIEGKIVVGDAVRRYRLYIYLIVIMPKSDLCLIYPTKKKRTSKVFPLSSPFNAKMLIVIKFVTSD